MTVTMSKPCALVLLVACMAFVGCTTDGGPGTESPLGGAGGSGGQGGANAGGTGGAAGTAANPAGGTGGVVAGTGGMAGSAGVGGAGGVGGMGGMGGEGGAGGDPNDSDAGIDDEGFCTVECTGIRPDEGVAEACGTFTELAACEMHETGAFPAGCRWVTPESEPCLVP